MLKRQGSLQKFQENYQFKNAPHFLGRVFHFLAYLLLNRSTLPSVSMIFVRLPVKKGWHAEQTSRVILSFVERTLYSAPHAQVAVTSRSCGCMPFFMTENLLDSFCARLYHSVNLIQNIKCVYRLVL